MPPTVRRLVTALVLLGALIGFVEAAFAQSTYGAVVGTVTGTTTIPDVSRVRVDGTPGRVTLLGADAAQPPGPVADELGR